MKRKSVFILCILILGSILLSACASLLAEVEEAVQGNYGPAYSAQEHQTRTLDAIWKHLEEAYIYYDSAEVDWDTLHAKYQARIDEGLTAEEFIKLVDKLSTELPDGALTYQSRAERIENDTSDLLTYEGIGVVVGFHEEETPHLIILDVMAGSPAEKAGLERHDSIYKIDGTPISLEERLTVTNRIRGPAGSTVTLGIQTPGESERTVDVQRGKLVSTGKLEASLISGTQYGYVLFPPFYYPNMLPDLQASLEDLATNNEIKGLVIDLRIAGSSRGWPLEDLLTLFHTGKIGEYYDRANQAQAIEIQGTDFQGSQSIPLVILIGANTSGSPEIMAAGLQAGDRATLVGQSTLGSVEATQSFYLPDGSRVFIETVSFRLLNDAEIGSDGLQPDILIDAGWDDIQPNADPVLDAAVEVLDGQQ